MMHNLDEVVSTLTTVDVLIKILKGMSDSCYKLNYLLWNELSTIQSIH